MILVRRPGAEYIISFQFIRANMGDYNAFPFRCHCQTLTPPLLLQSSSNPLLALQTSPYPSSFKYSPTSLPSCSSSTRAPKNARCEGRLWFHLLSSGGGAPGRVLGQSDGGKEESTEGGNFLSDRRVASRRRYLFGLCTLKCSLS